MTKADKEEQRKTPILRFKGFTDDWEQRQLSNVIKLIGGNAFKGSSAVKEGIPWLKITNVGKNGINWDTQFYLPFSFWNKWPNYQLFSGDYVMALTRPVLDHTLKIGKMDRKALLNQRVSKLEFNFDKEFTFQLLQRKKTVIEIEKELAGSDPPNLGSKNLKNIKIFLSVNPDEQKRIGLLFRCLDNLLALYERKIKALKKLKQAIFEVLNSIPHKSNVYRISEIFDVTRGNVLSKKSISNKFSNMYPVYSSQTKNDGLLGYYSDYLFENSITWTTDGANAGTVKYRTGKFYCTNVCGVLLNSEGYCNEYTAEVIEKETPKFVSHVGNPKLMNNVMKQIKIKLPDVATQQSYSDILLTFDNVCTSFCNKLNDLNQIKNKLLNTMFI